MSVAHSSRGVLTVATLGLMAVASSVLANPPAGWEAHPPHHVKNNATSAPSGLTPAQVTKAYGVDQVSGQGKGRTIAIVDAYDDPNAEIDLDTFNTTFGLQRMNQAGGPTFQKILSGGKVRANSNWALEISLDIEWAHAIAPQANIILVEAKSNGFSDLLAACDLAVKNGATAVSCSWGGSEFSSETSYDQAHFNVPGVTFTVSSGDNGTPAEYPSSSPYVVSVGGTNLQTDSTGTYQSETGWTSGGGGTSAYEAKPPAQNFLSGTMRQTPDVALVADPNTGVSVYDSYGYNGQKGWFTVGGTSASAPMWAGIITIANGLRTNPIPNALNALYAYRLNTSTDYHDITSGNNGLPAGPGYDEVTGIGSARANGLIPDLVKY